MKRKHRLSESDLDPAQQTSADAEGAADAEDDNAEEELETDSDLASLAREFAKEEIQDSPFIKVGLGVFLVCHNLLKIFPLSYKKLSRLAYVVLCCAILTCFRLFWLIFAYVGLFWLMLAYVGLIWAILAYFGLFWPILAYIGLFWPILSSPICPVPKKYSLSHVGNHELGSFLTKILV